MSEQSTSNLEFLKKKAKALLKAYKEGDSHAVSRVLAGLPHIASGGRTSARPEINLSNVQYVLAQEEGFRSWGALKQAVPVLEEADFSKPGSMGELPEGFVPWKWSVSYTVQPQLLSPLVCGTEYSIGASVLRSQPNEGAFRGYSSLYERATAIIRHRVSHLTCSRECSVLQTRILGHTWFRHGDTNLVRAAITLGFSCSLQRGGTEPASAYPSAAELSAPGGMTPEKLAALPNRKGFDEVYSDGDVRAESGPDGVFTFSYGEYVKTVEDIDFRAMLRRAERMAATHFRLPGALRAASKPKIVKREWFYVTNPNVAVIHVYLRQ